jgi:hypothetical protein
MRSFLNEISIPSPLACLSDRQVRGDCPSVLFVTYGRLTIWASCFGSFLGHRGSIYNTISESMCRAAKELEVDHNAVIWIHAMLIYQQTVVSQTDCTVDCLSTVSIHRGSHVPTMWSLTGSWIFITAQQSRSVYTRLWRWLGNADNRKFSEHCPTAHLKGCEYTRSTKTEQRQELSINPNRMNLCSSLREE